MLRVFYSERIEDLALHLKLQLLAERSVADAFSFSQVVVPNANIAKWLRIRAFADAPSLCAGVEFPFIEQALYRAMNESLDASERAELLPMNAYANGIMAILLGERTPTLDPFYRYIAATSPHDSGETIDPRKAWQLCIKLADLMDQYEVRRPDIVANWLRGKGLKGGEYADETEMAEAEVARRLFGTNGIYPPNGNRLSLRQLYERVATNNASTTTHQPPRTTHRFFGLSTLTPLQVKIFRWLAKSADVEVYHNNVCLEYWGDIETQEESRRLRQKCRIVESDEDFAIENPLLRQWGVAGRETMRLLARLEEEGDEQVAFEWQNVSQKRNEPTNVLETVQRGIFRRTGDVTKMPQDSSLQVVAACSIRREVEMVHNAILGLMLRGESGDFSDIAVLVTDMRRYRPMIEAVFNGRGVVPYGLIDTSASDESDCLAAFSSLMSLARNGLNRATLFGVIENPCIQRAMGFGEEDVREWRRLAEEIGAFDGFEEAGDFANFTWEAGLSRLRLGFITDDSDDCAVCQCADANAMKFSEVVERLYREISPLAEVRKTCAEWSQILRDVISCFIDTGDNFREDSVRIAICEVLGNLRQIPGEQTLAFVAAAVEELVGGMKSGANGYLTRGVTIASLQPMRPVPFRNIFVLGMGEGDFPGRESSTTLDMRGTKRGLGDASTPVQNRYLFLETFMAVRDRLVISYPSLDTQKDAELFPSGLVGELEKFVEDAILPNGEKFREIPIPLLERGEEGDCPLVNPVGEISWDGYWAGVIPTYSSDARRLAMRIANGERRPDPRGEKNVGAADAKISAKELAKFIQDPLQGVLNGKFGIPCEYGDDGDEDAPLELASSGLARWGFDERAIAECVDGSADCEASLEKIYDSFAAHGKVPQRDGFFGGYSFRRLAASYLGNGGFLGIAAKFAASLHGDDTVTTDLILKNSEYNLKGKKFPPLPPKATIEPLLKWLMKIAEKTDDSPRSLEVGIVDFDHGVCAKWAWRDVTPDDARKCLASIIRRYGSFKDDVAPDGRYLKMGYRYVVNSLVSLEISALPSAADEYAWRNIADAMTESKGSRSDLVISPTKESLERLPLADDWQMLRDFCLDVLPMILKGGRVEL